MDPGVEWRRRPARLHLYAAVCALDIVAIANEDQIDRNSERRIEPPGRRRNAGDIEIAPVAADEIDADIRIAARLHSVTERQLAHIRRGQRPVEIRRVTRHG